MTEIITPVEGEVQVYAKPGSRITDEQARIVHREASRLPEEHRTAENLVELARNPNNPVHPLLFRWSEAEAAELWRREQARMLMRSVWVRVVREDAMYERPAFYSVRVEENKHQMLAYVSYSASQADEALREQLLGRAYRDLEAFRARYDKHKEIFNEADPDLTEILAAIDAWLRRRYAEEE